ncbi:hypothetical protein, partial [Nostoc sp. ChiQUE01b]|uniref:hypothetical protein n=1 Tax=Nostoc sp. ChiQUE01b TaxID=3075376 RepID=UPI002AD5B1FF
LFLPVRLLYTALQFLIKFYYYSKPNTSYQVCLLKRCILVFAGVPNTAKIEFRYIYSGVSAEKIK